MPEHGDACIFLEFGCLYVSRIRGSSCCVADDEEGGRWVVGTESGEFRERGGVDCKRVWCCEAVVFVEDYGADVWMVISVLLAITCGIGC